MIKVDKVSFSFPQKDLYNKISFRLEDNEHCAFIGTNGTGKSTLIDMLRNPEGYLFDGKLEISEQCRIGYVSQFSQLETDRDCTVFEYISEEFVVLQEEINSICAEMETTEDMEPLMENYQFALDSFQAIDGDYYESNIKKQLKLANLHKHETLPLSKLSGGEFKLIQVIKELISRPHLMIMDEPDVFLDFNNLNGLKDLINAHKGIILVITHNRYLLNHCFNKILHLENTELKEWDGTYIAYNFSLLQRKIELQEQAMADLEEIERNKQIANNLRREATIHTCAARGRAVHARMSLLDRLEERRVKEPFVDIKQPTISLIASNVIEETIALKVEDYSLQFDELLLEHVGFELKSNEKVALVGPNGSGKTTLLREIYEKSNGTIEINQNIQMAYLSQQQGGVLNQTHTLLEEFREVGYEDDKELKSYLLGYGFNEEDMSRNIQSLSGGEKSLLQLAQIARAKANLLLLDEPTRDLDVYAQSAFEKAIADYEGAILMVSHDFYTIANCMDYVLFIEGKTIRKMRIRKFRQMIYANHFNKDYLEMETKKKEIETKIAYALQDTDFKLAKALCEELEKIVRNLNVS